MHCLDWCCCDPVLCDVGPTEPNWSKRMDAGLDLIAAADIEIAKIEGGQHTRGFTSQFSPRNPKSATHPSCLRFLLLPRSQLSQALQTPHPPIQIRKPQLLVQCQCMEVEDRKGKRGVSDSLRTTSGCLDLFLDLFPRIRSRW